jgi:predicted DNA binding CopG/RHH family protein
MDIQLIASIVGGLIFAYFISDEENKPKDKRNKYYANYGRPVVKGILKSRGVDLSDEYIKDIHKTLMSAAKNRGISEFHKHVTPVIEKKLSKAFKELDSNSSDDEIKKITKTIVKDFLKTQGVQELRTKYTKTKPKTKLPKSSTSMSTNTLNRMVKEKLENRGVQFQDEIREPRAETANISSSAPEPTGKWANLKDSDPRGRSKRKYRKSKKSKKKTRRTRKR